MDLQKGYKPISDSENNLSEISDELNAKTITKSMTLPVGLIGDSLRTLIDQIKVVTNVIKVDVKFDKNHMPSGINVTFKF